MNGVFITNKDGVRVRQSCNLLGIMAQNRRTAVGKVQMFKGKDGAGALIVDWVDGTRCVADFQSATVMATWVASRRAFKGLLA